METFAGCRLDLQQRMRQMVDGFVEDEVAMKAEGVHQLSLMHLFGLE